MFQACVRFHWLDQVPNLEKTLRIVPNFRTCSKFRSEFGSRLDARFQLDSKSEIGFGPRLGSQARIGIKSGSGTEERNKTGLSEILKAEYESSQISFWV